MCRRFDPVPGHHMQTPTRSRLGVFFCGKDSHHYLLRSLKIYEYDRVWRFSGLVALRCARGRTGFSLGLLFAKAEREIRRLRSRNAFFPFHWRSNGKKEMRILIFACMHWECLPS